MKPPPIPAPDATPAGPAAEPSGSTPLSMQDAVTQTMEEARMVLPGIQALFGFQLVAVFNQRFETALSPHEQMLHLAALMLVGLSIALTMTPAAYHRQTERKHVSPRLLRISSTLICAALVPLMLGLTMDIYLVARIITRQAVVSAALALLLLALLAGLWFVFPRWQRRQRRR